MMMSESRLVCSPICEYAALGTLGLSFKYDSKALFIDATSFPRIAFHGNKQVVWRPGQLAIAPLLQGVWQR